MAITIVNDVPQFTDDSNSARVSTVYHQRGGVHVLIGTSTYLIAGSAATLSALWQANPSFRVVTLQSFLRELLGSTDLTPDRLADSVPGKQGR